MAQRCFISYRREDTGGHAGRLFDGLATRFGPERVFMDLDSMLPAVDFVAEIHRAISEADVVIAVIGRRWISTSAADGTRRLEDPADFVRLELLAANERGVPVLPILVQGAPMPLAKELPQALQWFARRSALALDDSRWSSDVERIVHAIVTLDTDRPPIVPTSAPIPPSRRRTVTVLSGESMVRDAAGAELDPEVLPAVQGRCFDALMDAIRRHDGQPFLSADGTVLGVFGIPQSHEDDALRAVRAADEARGTLRDLARDLVQQGVIAEYRLGIRTGGVVAGPVRHDVPVTGETVNMASRIAAAGSVGDILIDADTFRLVQASVSVERREPATVPHTILYRLLEVRNAAPIRNDLASFVGRSRELDMLKQALSRATADRACQVFTILGSAGTGKSRLVAEFLEAADVSVIKGRCLSYGRGITYWPLSEMMRDAAGIVEEDDQARALGKLAAIISREDGEVAAGRIGGLIGLSEATASPQEAFAAVRKVFETLARRRRLVLVFEDIHWAEQALLDLIEHLVDRCQDAPMLLICLAREELLETRPGWGGGRMNATTILLEPLDQRESADLVRRLLGHAVVPPTVEARVSKAAGGNPLFVEELVRMLIDDGAIRELPSGEWEVSGDLSSLTIPPTIQALLAARLDRLDPSARELLECASVEGTVFHVGAVRELVEVGRDLESGLSSLTRRALIRSSAPEFTGEEAFSFRHQLIRDAAYESLRKQDRASLHRRFAGWLGAHAGPRVSEYDEILGYHLETAVRYREELGLLDDGDRQDALAAADHLASAGHHALARSDMRAAANLLSRARDLHTEDLPRRLDWAVALSDALIELGQLERAEEVLDATIERAAAAGDRRREARARVLRSFLRGHREDPVGWTDEALHEAEQAIEVFGAENDPYGLARAYQLVAEARWGDHAYEEAQEALELGLEAARAAGDPREEAKILAWLPAALFWGPAHVDEAIARCEEVLRIAQGDRSVEARCQLLLAGLHGMRGDFAQARSIMAQSRGALEELGMAQSVASLTHVSGMVEMLAGDWQAAEREYRSGFEFFRDSGDTGYLVVSAAFLARALYEQGRLEEAEDLTQLVEQTSASDDPATKADWAGTRAKILARRGELAEALKLAEEAVAVYERTHEIRDHADALMDLADVLRQGGGEPEGRRALTEAARLYERKGVAPSLARARTLLAERGSS